MLNVGHLQAQAASDGGGGKKSDKKLRKKTATDENPEDFIDPETPSGQKKLLASQMAKQYSPAAVEKSYVALVSPSTPIIRTLVTRYKKYVDKFFYFPFSFLPCSWYAWWESSQYFEADAASSKPPFVIVSAFIF